MQGDIEVGDIERFDGWKSVLKGMDAVVHLAGRAHVTTFEGKNAVAEFRRVNVVATANLARAALEVGVHRFIFVSSIGVNGARTAAEPFKPTDAPSPMEAYAFSKWEAEVELLQICAATRMQLVRVRPPLVLGPGAKGNLARLMQLVDRGIPLPFGAVSNRRQYIDVDDLCAFLELCITRDAAANELFLVAGAERISTPALLRQMARCLGRRVPIWPAPMLLLRLLASLIGRAEEFSKLTGSLLIDTHAAEERLGWSSRISISDSIESMAAWHREHKSREQNHSRERPGSG